MLYEALLPRTRKRSTHAISPYARFLGVTVAEEFYVVLRFDLPEPIVPLARGREFYLQEGASMLHGEPLCSVELRLRKGSPELRPFYVYEVPVK